MKKIALSLLLALTGTSAYSDVNSEYHICSIVNYISKQALVYKQESKITESEALHSISHIIANQLQPYSFEGFYESLIKGIVSEVYENEIDIKDNQTFLDAKTIECTSIVEGWNFKGYKDN